MAGYPPQQIRHVVEPGRHGALKRRSTRLIGNRSVRPAAEQQFDNVSPAPRSGIVQSRSPRAISRIDGGAMIQQQRGHIPMPAQRCIVQRRRPAGVLLVYPRAVIQQDPGNFSVPFNAASPAAPTPLHCARSRPRLWRQQLHHIRLALQHSFVQNIRARRTPSAPG